MDIDDIFIVLKSVSSITRKGLVVNYIVDLVRNYGPDKCDELFIVQKISRFGELIWAGMRFSFHLNNSFLSIKSQAEWS